MSSGKSQGSALRVIARLLVVLEAAALTFICLYMSSFVPFKYLGIVIICAVLVLAIQIVLVSGKSGVKGKCIASIILSIILIAASVTGSVFINNVYSKLKNTQAAAITEMTSTMNVYVRKADGIGSVEGLGGKKIGILDHMDAENSALAVDQLEHELNLLLETEAQAGILGLSNALKNNMVDAIIINSAYEMTLTDNDESFKDWSELLTQIDVTKTVNSEKPKTEVINGEVKPVNVPEIKVDVKAPEPVQDMTVQPFLVYLQGMDTRGDQIVADVGNSDVNMVVAVNPVTKNILLVNIPRDYYYYLWGDSNYPDKLTHSGYYGVECSIATLNSLFGIDINYYVKVGFNSVINIVDALGGITVNSDYAFELDGSSFNVGENYLDGYSALQFARERMSLPGGDRARGMNQQKVITAIIQKATSPEMLPRFNEVLEAVTSNVVTSISIDDLNSIVKMQLNDMATWNVESIQVDGAGGWDFCYSLGDSNDVMYPDMGTVEAAKARIAEVMGW